MTTGERLNHLRKTLNLTLEKFGERLGVKKNTLSSIEHDKNNLTEQLLLSICREYNVNEQWLRTGEGEMFSQSSNLSLDEFLKQQDVSELEAEIVKLFFSVDKNIRTDLLEKLKNIFMNTSALEDSAPEAKHKIPENPTETPTLAEATPDELVAELRKRELIIQGNITDSFSSKVAN